jgi:transposase
MTDTTRPELSVSESRVYVAFELSKATWKLALTSGIGVEPMLRTVRAGDFQGVQGAISAARTRFGVPTEVPVISCYEAGRDGFWIHRRLTHLGIHNRVVDSASIEVNRRARRAKTDRLDALKLVRMLARVGAGERRVWSEVRVPSLGDEAARHVSRERTALVQEQTRLVNQMRGWLTTYGTTLPGRRAGDWWTRLVDGAGQPLPGPVHARLARAEARLRLLQEQLATLETQQQRVVTTAAPEAALPRLVRLKGVATTSASVLLDEGLVWRAFRNRRQIGGLLGFAPVPYDSGDTRRSQGISRAGNERLQSISIQLAWNWVRWQPGSALTRWYRERFGAGKRARRIGIVALARKLLIVLWRYATTGQVPAGAVLTPSV